MAAFATSTPLGISAVTVSPWSAAKNDIKAGPAAVSSWVTMLSPGTLAKADLYMSRTAMMQYKKAAASAGTYTTQCAEGSTHGSAYDTAVRARTVAFRQRQASASARFADLYETRRAAIVGAHGCHTEETQLCNNPVSAAAIVIGKAEAMQACSRYVLPNPAGSGVEKYMAECVARQYKALAVSTGVYGTACCDGGSAGEADDARVAALAAEYRAKTLSAGVKAQSRYNASLQAIALSRGCDYEDVQYSTYPSMAASMKWGSGVYAAAAAGADAYVNKVMDGEPPSLAERLIGPNAGAMWPSSLMRPGIDRETSPWNAPAATKQYGGMSGAAVEYGVAAQTGGFKPAIAEEKWTSGWQPKSTFSKDFS